MSFANFRNNRGQANYILNNLDRLLVFDIGAAEESFFGAYSPLLD